MGVNQDKAVEAEIAENTAARLTPYTVVGWYEDNHLTFCDVVLAPDPELAVVGAAWRLDSGGVLVAVFDGTHHPRETACYAMNHEDIIRVIDVAGKELSEGTFGTKLLVCENCRRVHFLPDGDEVGQLEDVLPLELCSHLGERLEPGSRVPDGECRKTVDGEPCGAFVYAVNRDELLEQLEALL